MVHPARWSGKPSTLTFRYQPRPWRLDFWPDIYFESEITAAPNARLGLPRVLLRKWRIWPFGEPTTLQAELARTLAALSATNEAILYAKSPEELYRKVCEAAFSSGDFLATAVFLFKDCSDLLDFVAGFGEDSAR